MATENRDFKGVWIPREVWLDDRLNALDKIILTEIDSLDMSESGCFASNGYIAEFCQCSEVKVSRAVSKLIECGYLYVKSFDGRQRVLKSRLAILARQTYQKDKADLSKRQNNNTYTNTDNKTSKDVTGQKRKRFTPPTLEEIETYCRERQNGVDPKKFYDYFTASDWVDSRGQKVRSWKQKIITWEGHANKKTVGTNGIPISNAPSDLDGLF